MSVIFASFSGQLVSPSSHNLATMEVFKIHFQINIEILLSFFIKLSYKIQQDILLILQEIYLIYVKKEF